MAQSEEAKFVNAILQRLRNGEVIGEVKIKEEAEAKNLNIDKVANLLIRVGAVPEVKSQQVDEKAFIEDLYDN